jgi:FMN phosphatase YigB (HAD superfamily)
LRVNHLIAEEARASGIACDGELAIRVRRAMCIPLDLALRPFPCARELLVGLRPLGLRTVVISNSTYRDAAMYLRDFTAAGWDHLVDGYVTSVDVGHAKPDEQIFRVALEVAGTPPEHSVMIGDTEQNGIIPARELGMRSILVAIEEPPSDDSTADACAANLKEVLGIVSKWRTR